MRLTRLNLLREPIYIRPLGSEQVELAILAPSSSAFIAASRKSLWSDPDRRSLSAVALCQNDDILMVIAHRA